MAPAVKPWILYTVKDGTLCDNGIKRGQGGNCQCVISLSSMLRFFFCVEMYIDLRLDNSELSTKQA